MPQSFALALTFLCTLHCSVCFADTNNTTVVDGTWKVIGMRADGKPVGDASWRGMRYEFKNGSYKMWAGTTTPAGIAGKPPLKGPFSVDDDREPHHFNFTMIAGSSRRNVEAIYKIEDKKLFLCLGKKGHPSSFDTADTKNLCYILERVRNSKEQ